MYASWRSKKKKSKSLKQLECSKATTWPLSYFSSSWLHLPKHKRLYGKSKPFPSSKLWLPAMTTRSREKSAAVPPQCLWQRHSLPTRSFNAFMSMMVHSHLGQEKTSNGAWNLSSTTLADLAKRFILDEERHSKKLNVSSFPPSNSSKTQNVATLPLAWSNAPSAKHIQAPTSTNSSIDLHQAQILL